MASENSDTDTDVEEPVVPHRRNSVGEDIGSLHVYLVDVDKTRRRILRHEDTDGDEQVTIEDRGPKHIQLPVHNSAGYRRRSIRGNYMVSSLLQELALVDLAEGGHGPLPLAPLRRHILVPGSQLRENPVERLNRMISRFFWPALVRRVDADGLAIVCLDPKNRGSNKSPRIYVPASDRAAQRYFEGVAESRRYLGLEVVVLPATVTAEYVCSINDRPGILALATEEQVRADGTVCTVGKPFVVPGGRFNEMYGWDSYFAALGLLEHRDSPDFLHIAKSMVDNLVYQIRHYGKILNANRSYYLMRSQPPFLTDMALHVYRRLAGREDADGEPAAEWLRGVFLAAIAEYRQCWMVAPRYVPAVGLNRYGCDGRGVPPETEATHFDMLLGRFAAKHSVDPAAFIKLYNDGAVHEPELDEYFRHDRAVRESGHDTTYRLDGRAADLATVDLCALLYKYERDTAEYLRDFCGGSLTTADGRVETAAEWQAAADRRQAAADRYLWCEEEDMYFDYDVARGERSTYESVTALWPLWAGMCTAERAERLVRRALPLFEVAGGLVSGTERSLGTISLDRPNRQWDYPYGWAPHQILAWTGLERYGYVASVRRLAYRWLYMITRAFYDYNGVVPEKFDVIRMSHKVHVEYGNVGTEFKKVPREGFGWMNASYVIGQKYLGLLEMRALGALVPPESLLCATQNTR